MRRHEHDTEASLEERSVRKLGLVAAINVSGFIIELFGGLVFGSVALLGDAFHMLFDGLAYIIALGATWISHRSNPSGQWTYGLHRVEPFAAFLNGVLLVPMVVYLVYESYTRYLSPVEINATMTILLAIAGFLINLGSVYVLQGSEMNLNERGAYYHLLGDTGASLAVIISMVIIQFTGITIVDPLTAVLIAGLIIWSAVKLLWESGTIFFQQSPVQPEQIQETLESLGGVERVEDLHIWSLSSQIVVSSVYVTDLSTTIEERDALVERIHDVLGSDFGVTHATVEVVNQRHEHTLSRESRE